MSLQPQQPVGEGTQAASLHQRFAGEPEQSVHGIRRYADHPVRAGTRLRCRLDKASLGAAPPVPGRAPGRIGFALPRCFAGGGDIASRGEGLLQRAQEARDLRLRRSAARRRPGSDQSEQVHPLQQGIHMFVPKAKPPALCRNETFLHDMRDTHCGLEVDDPCSALQ